MSTEDLREKDAVKKMKELAEDIKVAMMITGFQEKPLNAIPMTTKKIDPDGSIWFLSLRHSAHNEQLVKHGAIQLLYSDPSKMEYLSIFGEGRVHTDQDILSELYSKADDNWFNGATDPDLTAIQVRPHEAYYWDSKSNKYLSLFKLGLTAISGKKHDIGKKGKLNL